MMMIKPPRISGSTVATAFLLLCVGLVGDVRAQSFSVFFERAFPSLEFEVPVALKADPSGSGWLFVVEKEGRIRTFPDSDNAREAPVVLDIRDRVVGSEASIEAGLLGLAHHPEFGENGYIYIFYMTDITGVVTSRVSRFTTSGTPAVADVASELVLIEFERGDVKHNGGDMHFSEDGYLFVSFGDGYCCGDPANKGQDRTNLFSTIIRIDVDNTDGDLHYAIPDDNPFVGNTEGWREEIWAYGLRNPWRFSLHPETGEIWVGDVGEVKFEEVNRIVPGGNYGWSTMDGPECLEYPPGSGQGTNCEHVGILPVWYYGRDVGIAVTGGYFYRGPRRPELEGLYIFADWGARHVFAATVDEAAENVISVSKIVNGSAPFPSAFGEGTDGELYLLGYFSGEVFRFKQSGASAGAPQGQINLDGPNPFRTATRLQIDLLHIGIVQVELFDALGRRVRTLLSPQWMSPGVMEVDLVGTGLAAGSYYAVLVVDGQVVSDQRVTLVR